MKTSILILFLFLSTTLFSQDSTLNWLTFEQTSVLFEKNQKPIMVFLYSKDDLKSKKMLETTFANQEVYNYLNILFYSIKFDIETDDTLQFFNGKKFGHLPNEKYHSLVKYLAGDSITLPALVMFNRVGEGRVFFGSKNRDSIFPTLIYYSENIYNSTTYEEWEDYYFKAFPPGQKQIITRLKIRWQTMNEMLQEYETKPKMIFIDLYDSYNTASTVMRMETYNNPKIAEYLNKNFYRVTVKLRSEEEFELKGVTYKNSGTGYKYHQFPYAVLNGNLQFPAFVILDEDMNLIERKQIFMTPEIFEPIIHFYGDGNYKNQDYKTFFENFNKNK